MGTALCSPKLFFTSSWSFGSLTSIPGQPNHWNLVDLVNPDREVTRPPLEIEDWKAPLTRFTDNGRRFETMMSFRFSSVIEPILLQQLELYVSSTTKNKWWVTDRIRPKWYSALSWKKQKPKRKSGFIHRRRNGKWQIAPLRQYERKCFPLLFIIHMPRSRPHWPRLHSTSNIPFVWNQLI